MKGKERGRDETGREWREEASGRGSEEGRAQRSD